jgi:DNA-binding XRE family transcriptional regulator
MTKKFAELVDDRQRDPAHVAKVAQIRAEFEGEQLLWTLNELREQLGVTQDQLAERLGVTQSAISQALNRPTPASTIETLSRLVAALGGVLSLHVDIDDRHLVLAI